MGSCFTSLWLLEGLNRDTDCVLCCRYVLQTYSRPNMVFTSGIGCKLYDAHGKEYLDFAAGIAVNALGEPTPSLSRYLELAHRGLKFNSLSLYIQCLRNPWQMGSAATYVQHIPF